MNNWINKFEDFGIDLLHATTQNNEGERATLCPVCSHDRKPQNRNVKCLRVNTIKGTWFCHNCMWTGGLLTKERLDHSDVRYINKQKSPPFTVEDKIVKWFWEERKISLRTLTACNVGYDTVIMPMSKGPEKYIGKKVKTRVIAFNYFYKGGIVDIKYRDLYKNFTKAYGTDMIFYLLDNILESDEAIITEGEIDALSFYEAGLREVVSVPNGSVISEKEKADYELLGNKAFKQMILKYLDHAIDIFKNKKVIYIATDDDLPGIKLREELGRRLGKDRCKLIQFKKYGCKDANQILVKFGDKGPEMLRKCKEEAIPFPIQNVKRIKDVEQEIWSQYKYGLEKGKSIGFSSLDGHFLIKKGHPILIHGRQNSGKSTWLLNVLIYLAYHYNYRIGLYMPETYPISNIYKILIEILIGNSFDKDTKERMSEYEVKQAIEWIYDKFYVIDDDSIDGYNHKTLNDKFIRLVEQYGIDVAVKDPWNAINDERLSSETSHDYLIRALSFEVRFAVKYNLVNIIVAHPNTPLKSIDGVMRAPTVFEISGGVIWANKMYDIICVNRPEPKNYEDTNVEIHVQKIKFHDLCGIPTIKSNPVILNFNRRSKRYYEKIGTQLMFQLKDVNFGKQQKEIFEEKINEFDYLNIVEKGNEPF